MPAGNNRINFQIGYTVDKAGLEQMQSLFQQIANKAKEPGNELNKSLQQAGKTAEVLDGILEKTFNTNLGTLNVTKFNQELSKSGLTLRDVQTRLVASGNQGATAYNKLAQSILGTNQQLKQGNKLLDDMADTFTKTVRWGIASSVFNNITNSIQKAYDFTKNLDTSLNDIRIVTDKSAESMERFAQQAQEAAKGMGASTLDYTNAALIYYQQGLTDAEVQARAETTLKAANVTGQRGEEVSEQLTAVWNGYKVTAEETELYVDKLAAVAASTAADLEELSTGMSKVASAANAMGVDFDDLNAQLATIVSVTRQAPESVGTALKTIYARLGDLKTDGTDEFGVSLGEVSSQLSSMGIQILDTNGDLRDMTTVMAEVAEKWQGWTAAQRQAAAVAMAGKRQYNNLIALFENWDMYTDALETSADAMGTLQHQQDIYMESTEAKLQRLRTTWQGVYDDIFVTDDVNAVIDTLTNFVQTLDNFINSFGGGLKAVAGLGSIVANVFSKQIANSINDAINKQEVFKQNLALAQASAEVRANGIAALGTGASAGEIAAAESTKIQLEYAQKIYDARVGLNQEQYNTLIGYQKEIGNLQEQITLNDQLMKKSGEKLASEEEYNAILQEGEDAVYRLQDKYDNLIIDLKESQTLTDTLVRGVLNGTYDNVSAQLASLSKYSKELTAEEFKRYKTIINEIHSKDDLANREKQIIQLFARSYKQQIDGANAAKKAAEDINNARVKGIDLEASLNGYKQQADGMLEMANSATVVAQRVAGITSALGNMAMAWSSIISLKQTWEDDSSSFGDKMLQTFTTLGFTLPMMISSFSKLNEVLGVQNLLTDIFSAKQITEAGAIHQANLAREAELALINYQKTSKEAEIALSQLSLTVDKEEIASIVSKVSAQELEAISTGQLTAEEVANNIANEVGIALGPKKLRIAAASISAKAAETAVTKTQAAVTEEATTAQWSLNAAMAANPIGAVVVGLTLLAGAIAGIVVAYDAFTVSAEEAGKQLEDSVSKYKETETELQSLQKELEDTQVKIDNLTAQDSLSLVEEKELRKLKIHNDYLQTQIDAKKELLKLDQQQVVEDAKQAAEKDSYGSEKYEQLSSGIGIAGYSGSSKYQLSGGYNSFEDMQTDIEKQMELAKSDSSNKMLSESERLDAQVAVEYYNNLSKQKDELLKKWEEAVTELQEGSLKAQETLPSLYSSVTDDEGNYNDENALSDIIQYYEKINLDYLKASGTLESSLQRVMEETFENDENMQQFLEDSKQAINDETQTVNEELLKQVLNEDQFALLQEWAQQYGISLYDIINETKNYNIQIASELEKAQETLEQRLTRISQLSNIAANVTSTLLSGGDLSDDQIIKLQQLESEYGELATIQDKQSQEYLNKLLEIREALEQEEIRLKRLQEVSLINDLGKIDVTADDEEFQDKLKEICDADYEVLVDIKTDTQDDFDTVVSTMDQIDSMASKIGESFIVAAEDIEELNNAFPGILANMTLVGDGTVQLNEEVVHSAMEAANAEVAADTNATVAKLQNQAEEMFARRDAAQNISDLAQQVANGEKKSAEVQGEINTNLETLKSDNSTETADQRQIDEKNVADVGAQSATSMANSFGKAYEIMAHDSIEWAKTAQAAAQAAINPDGAIPGMGNFSGAGFSTHANVATITSEKANIKSLSDYGGDYQAIADDYANLAKAYDEAGNNLIGKVGELVARGQGVGKNLQNRGSGLGNGKSSGGKGGGSEKEKEDKEFIKDEIDVLHSLEKQLESLERQVERLDKAREHLKGKDLRASLKQENKLLNQQIHAYKELIKGEEKQAGIEKGKLKKANIGIKFDKNNNITNYAETQQKIEDQYNAAIRKYNKSAKTEADEKILEAAKTQHDNLLKSMEAYEDHVKKAEDYRDDREEARSKKRENNLKSWETRFQIKFDKRQAQREWNSLKKTMNTDIQKVFKDYSLEAKNAVQDVRTYTNEKGNGTFDLTLKQIREVEDEIDKLNTKGKSSMFDNVDQAQTRLEELWKDLQSHTEEINQLWQDTWSAYLDNIDQATDKFQTLQDEFDRLTDTLEYQAQVVELVYGEKSYEKLGNIYQDQYNTAIGQIKNLKTESETWMNLLKDRLEKNGHTMDDMFSWDEDELRFYNNWMSAQDKINDKNLQALQISKQIYQNSINENMDQLERSLLNGSTLEEVEYEWERIRKEQEKYYDSAEKTYQIQTLANKMDKEINATNNLKAQQRLLKIRNQEIELLREKDKLTEYDIKKADLRYQLELKQMALEDARNNKTSMKLTRNEQGNWSYQYVANEDDVASKQQELLDVWNELYQLEDEYYVKAKEDMISTTKEYLESVRQIEEARMNNLISEEEKVQKLTQLQQDYTSDMKELASEEAAHRDGLQIASMGLTAQAVEFDRTAYEGLTKAEKAMVEGLKTANINTYEDYKVIVEGKFDEFLKNKKEHYEAEAREAGLTEKEIQGYVEKRMGETITALGNIKTASDTTMRETRDDWNDKTTEMSNMWNGNSDSVKSQIDQAYTDMDNADFTFRNQVEDTANASGQNFDEFGTHVGWATDDINWLTTQTSLLADETQSSTTAMQGYVDQVRRAWDLVKDAVFNAHKEFKDYVEDAKETGNLETVHKIKIVYETEGEPPDTTPKKSSNNNGSKGGSGDGSNSNSGGGGTNDSNDPLYEIFHINYGKSVTNTANRTFVVGGLTLEQAKGHTNASMWNLVNKTTTKNKSGLVYYYAREDGKGKPKSFRTGGYTGSWNEDSGRLAVLHQKELVLNKQDTSNFLKGINMIRDMSSLNGSISNAILKAMTNTALSLNSLKPGTISGGTANSNTDNVFNITAEFPNAENVNDIREAILSLPNIASQYANQHKL